MKRVIIFLIIVLTLGFTLQAQRAIVSCGGDISHSSGSISFTVGQIDYIYKNKDSLGVVQNYSAWEGVQQVYPVLQLVYDTICPGDSYALHGFNVGPFNSPGLIVDTIFVESVVNAMNDTTIRAIPPDTMKVLYLTIQTPHTVTPDGLYIEIIAGNPIPSNYTHTIGNGGMSYITNILPNNAPGISTIQIGSSFIYGLNPLTVSGTYFVEFTTNGPGCPYTFTDTIHIMDSLLCSIIDVKNDVSCALGLGAATVSVTGGSGSYNYLWMPSGQRTAQASGLTAGVYVVTVTDAIMGQTVTDTVIIDNDPFIIVITADDTVLCTNESTQLHTQIIGGNNSQWFDYYWTVLGPGTISDQYSADPTVTMVGTVGDVRTYQVEVTEFSYGCTATASISFTIQCETPPSISWTVTPNTGNDPIPYDDNLVITVYNPQPGDFVSPDCGYLYSINGGPWVPWTNTTQPIIMHDADIFVGTVTFEIKHNDTCSSGLIALYTWDISQPVGSIAYTRDTWWQNVCIGKDSVRLTDIALPGFSSATQRYEWMYAYHFDNGTQDATTWLPLTQLNDIVNNFNSPYVSVGESVNNTPTQPGDTIFISLRVQNTSDGGVTWTTVESETTFWIIQANPTFDIASLVDTSVCQNQTQSFYVETSSQGTISWHYGAYPAYVHAPISGTIAEFDYLVTLHPANSFLSLYDFTQTNPIEIAAMLTPTNGSCPVYIDTALLTIYPEETLILITDSSTQSQEFCLHSSLNEIRYVWGGSADSATVTWNNTPAGVQVLVYGDTLIIRGTPLSQGAYTYVITTHGNCSPIRHSGTIKVDALPSFSIISQDVECHGEANGFAGINLATLLGFENDYTFTWYDDALNIVDYNSQVYNLYAGNYSVTVTHNETGCSSSATVSLTEPATEISATVVGSDVGCYGGNNGLISVTPNGGTAPFRIYIYDTNDLSSLIRGFTNVPVAVNRTATNLRAGEYVVYVYDANNCLFTANVTITEPAPLVAAIIQEVPTTCYDSDDGIAEISVTGGTAPYQYSWSNGENSALITGLSPGIYYVTVTDTNNCAVSQFANITRPGRITSLDTVIACGSYIWNSIAYNLSGRYIQTLVAGNGCDSTVTLYLTILQNTFSSISVSACGSYTWSENQTLYTQSGTYTHTIVGGNAQGCDSTITLHLSIDASVTYDFYDTACVSYTWALNQTTYTASGTYSHSVPSLDSSDCDTTYILHLTIITPPTIHLYVNSCDDYTWDLNQVTYTQSGDYSFTLNGGNPNTCDTTFILHLYIPHTILSASINHTNITCYGSANGTITTIPIGGTAPYAIYIYDTNDLSYSIRGYTNIDSGATKTTNGLQQGTYLVEIIDQYGCIYTQTVNIVEPNELTTELSVLACDSYYWIDTIYTSSGRYVKTLTADNGCDSTVTLNLIINHTAISTLNVNSCSAYTWVHNGQTYYQSGEYFDTIIGGTVNGCDSIVVLNLYIPVTPLTATIVTTDMSCHNTNDGTISITSIGGDAPYKMYVYDTLDLTSSIRGYTNVGSGVTKIANGLSEGVYLIEIIDDYGCLYTQIVSINQPDEIITHLPITACDSYYWEGTNYTNSGTYTKVFTALNGCDSTVTLNLTISHSTFSSISINTCGSYTWSVNQSLYTQSGTYTHTIVGGNALGCDSIITLYLTIDTSVTYEIYDTACATYTWTLDQVTYTQSGTYSYSVPSLDTNVCDTTYILHLTIITPPTIHLYVNSCTDYTWDLNQITYTQSGDYSFTLDDGNPSTCDTIFILHLYIPQNELNAIITHTNISCYGRTDGTIVTAPIGGTAPYTIYIYDTNDLSSSIRGYTNVDSGATKTTTILQQGTYLVEVIDQYGCTYMQLIDIIEPIEISHAFSVTACDSYYWIDSNYTTSGIYTKILIAPNGCDSIVTLNLTINYTVMSTFNANSCTDYTWAQNGQTYSQSGQYRDTIIGGSANGCDSIVVLNLYIPATPISALISSTDIDCYQVNNGTITITPMGGDAPYKILIFDINDLSSSIRGYNSVLLGDYRTATGLPAGTYLIEIEDNYGCSYVENITLTEPPQLSANISTLHPISCYQGNDGLLSVTTTGGTLPYAYLWQNGETGSSINGLNAGNYSVIVTDGNGCTANANILLIEPQEITSQFSLTACNSYYWIDSNYTRSGTYTKYLIAQNGCDSIVTLNLTINYTAISTFNANSCADYTWAQNGQTYYQSGQYRDTIMGGSANGCDSIVILNLHIPATPISASILSTDIDCYQANNGTITITPTGGDAPYNILIFDINDLSSSIRGYNSVSLGDYRTATGLPAATYLIEIKDNYGCSYVENVTLTEPSQLIANISILNPVSCYQSMDGALSVNVTGGTPSYSYLWNEGSTNNTIHGLSGGSYSVTIIDNNGCTVNANISLTEPQEITSQFSLIACDSYYWEGTNYTNSGTYTKTLTAQNGCDSIVTLHLIINRTSRTTIYESACQSYTWALNGQTYYQSGQYSHTIVGGSANGCDSIVTLSLYIPTSPLSAVISNIDALCYNGNSGQISITVSGGTANYDIDIYNINDLITSVGQFNNVPEFTQKTLNYLPAGTYQIEVFDHNGCNYTTTITINQPTPLNFTLTSQNASCYGNADGSASIFVTGGTSPYQYLWSNSEQTSTISNLAAGYYTIQVTDDNGCISMASTTISQPNRIVHEFSVTNCDSYTWNGVQYTRSDRYTNVFTAANGCDSIVTLNLTITNSSTADIYVSTCNSYYWFGTDYSQSGIYTHTLQGANSQGCDSIITLHLTINAPTHSHIYHNSCGDYLWNDQLYTISGEYIHTIPEGNSNGCDSIIHLHLTVNAATHDIIYQVACSSYTWSLNQTTYTQSGIYTDTIVGGNSNGCDSIITLDLTINQPTTGDTTVASCVSYTWALNGQTYSQSGDYAYTIVGGNSNGCDSTVTLHLTINQPTTGEVSEVACVSYTWVLNGETYTQSGSYSYTIVEGNANGCDSIVTLYLTINQPTENHMYDTACVEYRWIVSNETYYATGDYEYIIDGGNAQGCDSTIILHLVINQPSVHEITVITYQPYTWEVTGETYSSSGIYSYTYYGGSSNGCDSTVVLDLTVNAVGIEDQVDVETNISLYPNPTSSYVDIIISDNVEVKEAVIFDMYGKLLKVEKVLDKHPRISFDTYANGIYLLRLNDGHKVIKSFKVIKN